MTLLFTRQLARSRGDTRATKQKVYVTNHLGGGVRRRYSSGGEKRRQEICLCSQAIQKLFNSFFVNEKFKQPRLDSTASGSVSLSRSQSKVSFPEQRPIIELCGRYFMYRDIYCTTTSTLTQLPLNFTLGAIYVPIHGVPYRAYDGDGCFNFWNHQV